MRAGPTVPAFADWQGRPGYGVNGEVLGLVVNVFADDATGKPTWAAVRYGAGEVAFVPMAGVQAAKSGPTFTVDRQTMRDAPKVGANDHLSREDEGLLSRHYGIGEARPPVAPAAKATPTEAVMTPAPAPAPIPRPAPELETAKPAVSKRRSEGRPARPSVRATPMRAWRDLVSGLDAHRDQHGVAVW